MPSHVPFASMVEHGERDEDRVAVARTPGGLIVVVADGAGGVGGGAIAAKPVCDRLTAVRLEARRSPLDWIAAIQEADRSMMSSAAGGLTTAVVVEVCGTSVFGASVGDSAAWMIAPTGIVDLTQHQFRKPLVGNGEAFPVPFGPIATEGRVLIATDGLFKYAPRTELAKRAIDGPLADAVRALIDSVRLRSGGLQDDVAVALVELAP